MVRLIFSSPPSPSSFLLFLQPSTPPFHYPNVCLLFALLILWCTMVRVTFSSFYPSFSSFSTAVHTCSPLPQCLPSPFLPLFPWPDSPSTPFFPIFFLPIPSSFLFYNCPHFLPNTSMLPFTPLPLYFFQYYAVLGPDSPFCPSPSFSFLFTFAQLSTHSSQYLNTYLHLPPTLSFFLSFSLSQYYSMFFKSILYQTFSNRFLRLIFFPLSIWCQVKFLFGN